MLFLTRLPLPYHADWSEKACGESVKYFTLIGAVLGICNVLVAACIFLLLPQWGINLSMTVGTFLILLVHIAGTGALHCDGYTDTMDGLLSGRSRERKLEIMKDSHVGAHGVTALILLILGKYSLLAALYAEAGDKEAVYLFASALFFMPIFGRLAMVIAITCFPYARKFGMGKAFAAYAGKKSLAVAIVVVCFFIFIIGSVASYAKIISVGLLVMLFAFVFCHNVTRQIGGVTGDVYGAVTELSEFLTLLVFLL